MAKAIAKVKTTPNLAVKEPSMYKVIYINDDVTTMEFVIESLRAVFDIAIDTAVEITQIIHEEGSATVALLPYEMAEQKGGAAPVAAKLALLSRAAVADWKTKPSGRRVTVTR